MKRNIKEGSKINNYMVFINLILFCIVSILTSSINAQNFPFEKPHDNVIMGYARNKYIDDLPFKKNYIPGKFTAVGIPEQIGESTILELDGPGLITRIWTTNSHKQDVMNFRIYVDNKADPVLNGTARAIAAAAQKLSIPSVPWGGFLDGYSVSLYLPIPFKEHILIVAECNEKVGGPYWQIDYKLGIDPGKIPWKQIITPDGLQIIPNETIDDTNKKLPEHQQIIKEINVSFNKPVDILLNGPAVIRRITMKSNYLDKIQMRMVFDGDTGYVNPKCRTDHVKFQVDVPLKYFISNFNTAAIQRIGNKAIIHFPMPFKRKAMLQLVKAREEFEFFKEYPLTINIEYEKDPADINQMYYFNSVSKTEVSNGYRDFEVLNIRGEGHFVGVNLFNTGHDHGGGDNIFFDAGSNTAGQLHGICGEDYFHHAYMRTGINAPYIDCPGHSVRCRHHIEMPVPFHESFTFNWGSFAGVMPVGVAIWYQKDFEENISSDEMIYEITGPFPLESFNDLTPYSELPLIATVRDNNTIREFPRKTWQVQAQNGFIDLCHTFRVYTRTIPNCSGWLDTESCMLAVTRIWVERDAETQFIIGCDDPVKVYLGNNLIGEKTKYNRFDPYEQFAVSSKLKAGLNTITIIVSNKTYSNWYWNGFSLVLKNNLDKGQIRYIF